VGTALLETLLVWATTETLIEKVCLEVFTTNAGAIRLYRKLGFVEEGLRPKDIKFGPDRYVDTLGDVQVRRIANLAPSPAVSSCFVP
jgi:RimJ/RimL family protein N-acetyltransferase